MTGTELQARIVRGVERQYARAVAAHRRVGMSPASAHEEALGDALRLLGEALDDLRQRGLFPFPQGEIPKQPESAAGGGHA